MRIKNWIFSVAGKRTFMCASIRFAAISVAMKLNSLRYTTFKFTFVAVFCLSAYVLSNTSIFFAYTHLIINDLCALEYWEYFFLFHSTEMVNIKMKFLFK